MSLLGIHILSDAAVAHLKAAGHDVVEFAASEADKAVIAIKNTDIGKTVAADIAAVKDHSISNMQKFENVVSNTLPLVLHYVTGGGLSAVVSDVESLTRSLVQAVFNDTASTTAGKVAAEILSIIKTA
jgi:hypothetical protein